MMKQLLTLVTLCLFSFASLAQSSNVADEANAWLTTVDAGKYAESWQQAGGYFQSAISQAEWVDALNNARSPLGESLSRVVTESIEHDSLPGVPDGDYTIVVFESQFEHLEAAKETITLVNEASDWHVVGYFIAPGH
ncbi:DUF4019 domain-containing protein [Halomonas meridiana]|uniref:DUF4019 domain-containing protein n=1 Tax=Vreelandella aquamarina TaxID=77097 RepID=UPI00273AAC8D|nr:DUF4019 domain-containing protein [Halomonas meridiana]MDP4556520.1 DUF4019 domain-containing protein [Halomonas meridiana]